jgi:predicted RNA binding protein YcfA (HicA-like mRNA interferase family)
MKRRDLLRHLSAHGCRLLREGGRHSYWCNADNTRRSAVPRHGEISDFTARAICRDLGVPAPGR